MYSFCLDFERDYRFFFLNESNTDFNRKYRQNQKTYSMDRRYFWIIWIFITEVGMQLFWTTYLQFETVPGETVEHLPEHDIHTEKQIRCI